MSEVEHRIFTVDAVLAGKVARLGDEALNKTSAIAKTPVDGRVWLGETGLESDQQAELKVHGGPEKALHHYPFDHYAAWRREWQAGVSGLARLDQAGAFGENISTSGLTETDVCVGDVYRIGSAIVQVSQPRQPCWKLNLRFARADMSRAVQNSRRTGWYYRVLEAGEIGAGDTIERLARPHGQWSVERLLRVLYVDRDDRQALESMTQLDTLSPSWRKTATKRLESGEIESWSKRLDGPASASQIGA
ncbi:MOSC domain-containing protein [Paraburkholderia azotifigens]|uniref:MOSC domain-containing protein n=1 Tax=Paraburkholderia azotifigens TaxID=2057004 RepID=A0A5C6VRK7_9BURK|nr:MOSC domain-containing protein [Paraburkholderia azotifigens]TXC88112.1 MOSC domain-containing protein [Paraburkholderia azotifigens]